MCGGLETFLFLFCIYSEVRLGPYQTPMMDFFGGNS